MSLLINWFHGVHENSNRCDELRGQAAGGMGRTNGTGNGIGINLVEPGSGNQNGNEPLGTKEDMIEKYIPAHLLGLIIIIIIVKH